jgi:hypothetical protein
MQILAAAGLFVRKCQGALNMKQIDALKEKKVLTAPALVIMLMMIFVILSSAARLYGQEDGNSGIIYGKNHAFSLTAPQGWVLDNTSGVDQGLHAVFYKKGESWAKAVEVMYVNTASLEDDAHRTLEQLIRYDIDHFNSNYPDLLISDEKDIIINDRAIARVKYLSGESYGNFEALAYIDAGKTGVMIILTCRTKVGFDNSLAAFQDLVKSFFFMTEKVKIENSSMTPRD